MGTRAVDRRILAGLRVVDWTSGPIGIRATAMLADYGADVAWVEPPGGDFVRTADPASCAVFCRSKRAVEVDLDTSQGRDQLHRLLAVADVFVDGQAPGRAEEVGLGYDEIRDRYPSLVYCALSGFGPSTPPVSVLPAYEGLSTRSSAGTASRPGTERLQFMKAFRSPASARAI